MTAPFDHEWDAGDMGCGELVVKLKLKFRDEIADGEIVRVRSTDEGLPEDLPAWCSLTGHALVAAAPPVYDIRKKTTAPR